MAELLRVRGLEVAYGPVVAVRALNLDVHDGECLAILGARGAGTTTLLHCLAGVRCLDGGTVERQRPALLLANWDASNVQRASGDIVLVDDSVRTGATTLIPRIVIYASNSFTNCPSLTIFTGRFPGAIRFFSGSMPI